MRIQLAPKLVEKIKKQDVRIRKSFKQAVDRFAGNSHDPGLNSHELDKEWKGFKSIDITSDWRAIYHEDREGKEVVAYFVAFGTHKELYGRGK